MGLRIWVSAQYWAGKRDGEGVVGWSPEVVKAEVKAEEGVAVLQS